MPAVRKYLFLVIVALLLAVMVLNTGGLFHNENTAYVVDLNGAWSAEFYSVEEVQTHDRAVSLISFY